MKVSINIFIEKLILLFCVSLVLIFSINNLYYSNLIAYMVLIINLYGLIKSRKNPLIFFLFLARFYFDYSIIISKYISTTPNFALFFQNYATDKSMFVGISSLFVFHATLLLFLKENVFKYNALLFEKTDKLKEINVKHSKANLFILLLILSIAFILVDYLFIHLLPIKRTIYEYLLIPFIVAIYFSKNKPYFRKIILFLIIISTAVNMINGGRIVSLQPILAYFFIIFYEKISTKKIVLFTIFGIIFFTIAGLYGDILVEKGNIKTLTPEKIIETFSERKFALDTSISSYWTGTTYIESMKYISNKERIINFVQFNTSYALLGKLSNYTELVDISSKYFLHYYGGFITSYYYFWLGYAGIILIAFYISFLLNYSYENNKKSSDFKKILYVYILSCLPRWYLYYPTSLVRGVILLYIVYIISKIFIKNSELNYRGEL